MQLVGRERESAELRSYLDAALAGRGSVVLLAGEAGAGKTALAGSVLREGPADVLTGVGVQGGAEAFGPITEVFRAHLRSGDDAGRAGGPLADHLAVLLPELQPEPRLELRPAAPAGDRATLLEAIRLGLAQLAQHRPVAVFLDDLHWADNATLELLPALARSVGELPLLIAGAFRSDELPRAHAIRRMRGELRRAGLLHQIAVGPLGPQDTGALLARTVGVVSPQVSRAVFDRTDGVPFFVTELGAALAASGRLVPGPSGLELLDGADVPLPESVRDAVLLQASELSEQARAALTTAAVAGHAFDPELVLEVAQLDEWPDEVLRLGFVTEIAPARMAFRHALIKEAFYGEIPWTRRVSLHRAVAERLGASARERLTDFELHANGADPASVRPADRDLA